MTGFLEPLALLALPLALVPLVLEWHGRRTGEPVRFSSLYLLDRARRSPVRWTPTRSRWVLLLRALIVALLVAAAARPVGPGGGDPASHYPTRAVIAVDVSASVAQLRDGSPAWETIRAWADTLLAWGGPGDRLALAAVADGIVGWWEAHPEALRRQLARLSPTARSSDWPATLAALAGRLEGDAEGYLLTDGARGARGPEEAPAGSEMGAAAGSSGHRVVRVWRAPAEPNRGLVGATWIDPVSVALAGSAWGPGAPASAMAGRWVAGRLFDATPLALDGSPAGLWAITDTATFAFREGDRLPGDDRLYAAAGGAGGPYRVARWRPADEPPEPGALFWEAALAAAARGASNERVATLAALSARQPDLALLPFRAYRPDEAALLAELTAAGTRLLFAPACPEPACVPDGDWFPARDLPLPRLAWRLGGADRQAALLPGPGTEGHGAAGAPGVPDHLLARVPARGALAATGGPPADWTWDLATGEPALWIRGPVALWLVPLGPPVTRLGATPVFPLVAEAAVTAWDPRWGTGGANVLAGQPLPVPAGGATVTGPLSAGDAARTWDVAAGGAPPRPEHAGLYRIEARAAGNPVGDERDRGGTATFVAVNGDPGEGDLTPLAPGAWRAAWGRAPVGAEEWRGLAYARRRGPELWPWALALALAALAAEAWLRRASFNN